MQILRTIMKIFMVCLGFFSNGFYYIYSYHFVNGIFFWLSIIIAIAFILFEGLTYSDKSNKKYMFMWVLIFVYSIIITMAGQHFQLEDIMNKNNLTIAKNNTGSNIYDEYKYQLDSLREDKKYQLKLRSNIKEGSDSYLWRIRKCNEAIEEIDIKINNLMPKLEKKSSNKAAIQTKEKKTFYQFFSFGNKKIEIALRFILQFIASLIMALIAPVGLEMLNNDIKKISKKKTKQFNNFLSDIDKRNICRMIFFYTATGGPVLMPKQVEDEFKKRKPKGVKEFKIKDIEPIYEAMIKNGIKFYDEKRIMEVLG